MKPENEVLENNEILEKIEVIADTKNIAHKVRNVSRKPIKTRTVQTVYKDIRKSFIGDLANIRKNKKDIESKIDDLKRLEVQYRLYKEIKEELDKIFEGITKVKVGKYTISGSSNDRKRKPLDGIIYNFWSYRIDEN